MPDATISPSPEAARQSSNWSILLADDSASMRKSLATAIRSYDASIEIIEALTGRETLDLLVTRPPDLAFINLQLPEISGAEALAYAWRKGIRPLTILMSKHVLPKWVEVSTELGAYEFWRKRFDPAHVIQLLDAYRVMRTPMKLLVADQSTTAHDLIMRMLANCRFQLEVDHSDSGPHALGLARDTRYDVALVDSQFSSGMSGFEIACQIRAASPGTKLILMAGGAAGTAMQVARQFGLRSFLQKPFYLRDVEFALHAEFGLRRPYLLNAVCAPEAPSRIAGARP
ncbi:MAG TPA: response regulator [Beijerinckiaceae bacterium]|jgi:CheY-like chemotaxis protein